jgi:hypothetical protein
VPKRHRKKWYQMTLLLGLPESSVGWIKRFPLSTSSFYHGSSCTYVTREMDNSPVGGPQFRDVAPPPIDMIIIVILVFITHCLLLLCDESTWPKA